jgi:cell division protein FtsN
MLFGLAIGLSVAFAVYVNDRDEPGVAASAVPQPASLKSALDDNGETDTPPPPAAKPRDKRFTFYDILPSVEILTDDAPREESSNVVPRAIDEPGVYVLQAGSFSTHEDADRRRAELALQGIESHIQRVKVNARDYHRVYIGPTDDLDELNMLRSRLRAAKIDVLRIRVGD